MRAQDKNFSLTVPFLPRISRIQLPAWSFAPRWISGKRKPPFAPFTLGPHSCQVSAEQRCIRGLQSKGSRMANCHEFLQRVWHLGILLLSPSPRLIAENLRLESCLPYQLQLLPSFPVLLEYLISFHPGSEMKSVIYLAVLMRPPRL